MPRREPIGRSVKPGADDAFTPVFIVGCPRSGTTLLQRMLDAHPGMAVAPETHFIRRFWLRRDAYGDVRDDDRFLRLVEEVLATPEVADMHLDAAAFRSAASRIERSYPALFGLLLQFFAAQRQVQVVGEKTPNHLLHMPTLQQFFPAAQFIHIVRDPRAVVNSWRNVPWSTGTVAGDAHVWRRYLRTAWKQPPRAGSLHIVKYESLTARPERVLRAICRFLDIPFDPVMLAFHERGSETLDVEREPWKRGATGPLYGRAVNEWRANLSPTELGVIESICWPDMLWLGYRPVELARLSAKAGARTLRGVVRRTARLLRAQ